MAIKNYHSSINVISTEAMFRIAKRRHFERSAAEELALSEAEGGVEWEKSAMRKETSLHPA